jgi:hypothetical protein
MRSGVGAFCVGSFRERRFLLFFLEVDEEEWPEDEDEEDELDEAWAARGGVVRNTPISANREKRTTDLSEVHALAQRIF